MFVCLLVCISWCGEWCSILYVVGESLVFAVGMQSCLRVSWLTLAVDHSVEGKDGLGERCVRRAVRAQ